MNNLIPLEGNSNTFIDRLMEYISSHDFDFDKKIRGASQQQITQYCKLAKFGNSLDDLPISYCKFLETMGLDDGGLLNHHKINFSLKSLIEFYEDILFSEPETLDEKLPIIGTYIIGDQVSFDLNSNETNPRIVESSDGELMSNIANSLESLVMYSAMLYVESRKNSLGEWSSNSPANAKKHLPTDSEGQQSCGREIDLIAKELGLDGAWFNEEKFKAFISNEISFFAEIGDHNETIIYIFSNKTTVLNKAIEHINTRLGTSGGSLSLINGELCNA